MSSNTQRLKMNSGRSPIILCKLLAEIERQVEAYVQALKEQAPLIGTHGLDPKTFWESGIFRSAIEKIRGTQAASTEEKYGFANSVLDHMKRTNRIHDWHFRGSGERYDYEIELNSGRLCVVETKGCLDGNNTNIFERPPQADEFIIWSLCQNISDPQHNAWSGIHTRLGAEVMHRKQKVDGVVIWDMVCGTPGRPCPKLVNDPGRATVIPGGKFVPPPCIYLFPRSIPDPRNNPA